MTFEELNRRAARREPVPEGLLWSEQTAYWALSLIYAMHGLGGISRAEGVRMKDVIARELANMRQRERQYVAAETVLKWLRQSDCPAAKAVLRQMEEEMHGMDCVGG